MQMQEFGTHHQPLSRLHSHLPAQVAPSVSWSECGPIRCLWPSRRTALTLNLEAIIGSTDGDADRYVAMLAKAFKDKELPKRFKKGFDASKTRVMAIAELEADAEELDSDDDEDEEDDDDDEEEEDDEAKVDLGSESDEEPTPTKRKAAARGGSGAKRPKGGEPPSDLLAMFAARRQERQDGFDAFAARWEETSKREAAQAKGKKKKKGKGGTDYAW